MLVIDESLAQELRKNQEKLGQANDAREIATCNLIQAELLHRVVAGRGTAESAPWISQIADCLFVACLSDPDNQTAQLRLTRLTEETSRSMPGSALAAYVAYRQLKAYQQSMANSIGSQEEWQAAMVRFVQTYPHAQDAPHALLELGTIGELRGRRSEAKAWYERLISDFSDSPECLKAEGALRRLELPGREMFLALPLLFTENERVDVPFDLRALRGKPVIVYCWASWDNKHSSEINELKAVIDRYPARGVELLCVNLDSAPADGRACWSGSEAPGVHVFQRDGLNGAWAKRYGIMTLPFVIVVGRDGKVVTVNAPVDQIKSQIIRAAK